MNKKASGPASAADPSTEAFAPFTENRRAARALQERAALIKQKLAEAVEAEARALEGEPKDDPAQRREHLAAAIALGQITPAEAARVRAEIDDLASSIAKWQEEVAAARQPRAGLESELRSAKLEIETLDQSGKRLLSDALHEDAIRFAAAYLGHARAVYENYLELMARGALISAVTGKLSDLGDYGAGAIVLPAFNFPEHEAEVVGKMDPMPRLFTQNGSPAAIAIAAATKALIERLRARGIELAL